MEIKGAGHPLKSVLSMIPTMASSCSGRPYGWLEKMGVIVECGVSGAAIGFLGKECEHPKLQRLRWRRRNDAIRSMMMTFNSGRQKPLVALLEGDGFN